MSSDVFKKILKNWGSFSRKHQSKSIQFLVFLQAPIKENRFLLNPDETEFAADKYAYQKEVISVGRVKCDRVWYVPMYETGHETRAIEFKTAEHIDTDCK